MIQLLATRYPRHIAYCLFLIFLNCLAPTVYGRPRNYDHSIVSKYPDKRSVVTPLKSRIELNSNPVRNSADNPKNKPVATDQGTGQDEDFIGGPSQPEMSSFKPVGINDMVNLFTGDFSYNIPLMDVGGYPLNIFYDGAITPEQESSWVGLGWNINPGSVSRNMRGIPDDFNGNDTLIQMQTMKANKTWGVSVGADLELAGVKDFISFGIGGTMGVSFNNYLGPALELGVKGTTTFKMANKANAEKNATPSASVGLGATLNSRNGLTLSPNVSLSAATTRADRKTSFGLSLSTSYNSKTGIKALQLSEQMSFSNKQQHSSQTMPILSTTISFVKPSYIPSLRMPVTNSAFAGRFQLGGGIFGVYGSVEAEVYLQSAEVSSNDVVQKKPLVGYLYYQNAVNNPNVVMDFTRFNDAEVTPNTPVISAPQYSYDVFSIQGEGTGGSIRAYRNDLGYVRDIYTKSQDKSLSAGADIGIPGHYGANFSTVKTPSTIGEWGNGNKLRGQVNFTNAKDSTENVYFRNPGESSVLHPDQFTKIGGTDLVRYKLGGSAFSPTIEPVLERFSKSNTPVGTTNIITAAQQLSRKKRTQVTTILTGEEASRVGLNKQIKIYKTNTVLDGNNNLAYDSMPRVGGYRKMHHISQITVTESDGKQYVYDVPAYNVIQKDYAFTVNNTGNSDNLVGILPSELSTLNNGKDGYLQRTETPAYAHSFLLSGLLSADYVDVTGNGITEDDLGTAIKFNYTRIQSGGQWLDHPWKTPLTTNSNQANFNGGNRTESKDDKGIISFGKRESWYLHSVESKNMIALFTLEDRNDGKGPTDEVSGVNASDASQKRLQKIDLYNKADLKKNGIASAKPIKTVWFSYSYSLCNNTPDNIAGGKLTLDSIYFTFNGKPRASKNKYAFAYNAGTAGNLNYNYNSSDRWGNFKPARRNPNLIKNTDYPYSLQDKNDKDSIDYFSSAWTLNKILLPSGGQIEVSYESDDYAFVQNRRAAVMMEVAGVGPDSTTITNKLYGVNALAIQDYEYLFVKVPEPCATKAEVYQKYVQGLAQLAVKMAVIMPKGVELIDSYAGISDWGRYDNTRIWIKVSKVGGQTLSPLSLTALEFLREQLPGQAFNGYDVSESSGLKQIGEMLLGMLDGLKNAFRNPVNALRSQGKAQMIIPANSFVRLNDPDGFKYGGGKRVKSIRLKDNWKAMTKQFTSEYGQVYDYTTKEMFNGTERTISSGVASYEPAIGGEENPFQTIVQVADKLPLGPTSYGAIEMPILDAFFPAPVVGYSKVTVKSIKKGTDPAMKTRSGVGRQVTVFYTAKDFPVYYNHTGLDPSTDKQAHTSSTAAFFYKYAFDSRALSQGFIIEINDMHGKLKSQASYAENDSTTQINYKENFYRNTGSKGLNDKFDFVSASKGGVVEQGNMGVDIELVTDTREFSVKSNSLEIQGQVDLFPVIFPFWLPFIWPVSGNSENTYRAITTTKVINYHSVIDSVVVIDKGSQVSTRNLVYDSETGDVIVNRSNNEFDKPVYSTSYPAWWGYSNMALAYKNIDVIYSGVKFRDGKITQGIPLADINRIFESGDELYLSYPGDVPPGSDVCANRMVSPNVYKLWAFDKNKPISGLTNTNPDFVFMDSSGKFYTKDNVSLRIIKSGRRNILGTHAATASLMTDPVRTVGTDRKLVIDNTSKVISASAIEFKEKWQTDNDVIKKTKPVFNPATCTYDDVINCSGNLEKAINPYCKGLLTVAKVSRNLVFYENRTETDPLTLTNLPQNGFLNSFKLYWDFNGSNNLAPDLASTKWVWNSLVTRMNSKGLELETRDGLNIYTAAQYGFNKTLPVAITENSRFDEMANEGFEDISYDESINKVPAYPCSKRQLDFNSLSNSQVINTDSETFNAHTGKYALRVNPGTSQLTIPVASAIPTDFNFYFKADTAKGPLYDEGVNIGNIAPVDIDPDPFQPWQTITNKQLVENGTTYTVGGHAGMRYSFTKFDREDCNPTSTPGTYSEIVQGYSRINGNQYIEIKNCGNYSIDLDLFTDNNSSGATYILINQRFNLTIRDLDGNLLNSFTVDQNQFHVITTLSATLGKGVFLFTWEAIAQIRFEQTDVSCSTNGIYSNEGRGVIASFAIHWPTGQSTPSGYLAPKTYKTLASLSDCYGTKPMAAKDSMLNPVFSIPADKKMVFSAWVKETCGNPVSGVPCTVSTYNNNQVNIQFNDAGSTVATLKPSGPIIEGWQRYEGYFTAPVTATQATMNIVNSSGSMIYFDDIRIHPFNANMVTYVYDPVNLRQVAQLDANNYAMYYEYDAEGILIRTKAETKDGIKTIKETRSFQQRSIKSMQP